MVVVLIFVGHSLLHNELHDTLKLFLHGSGVGRFLVT